MQQVGDLMYPLRGIDSGGNVFDADNGAVVFGVVAAKDVVEQVAEDGVAVFIGDVNKRVVGHIPEVTGVNHIRDVGEDDAIVVGHGRDGGGGGEVGVEDGDVAERGVGLVLGENFALVNDVAETGRVVPDETEAEFGIEI